MKTALLPLVLLFTAASSLLAGTYKDAAVSFDYPGNSKVTVMAPGTAYAIPYGNVLIQIKIEPFLGTDRSLKQMADSYEDIFKKRLPISDDPTKAFKVLGVQPLAAGSGTGYQVSADVVTKQGAVIESVAYWFVGCEDNTAIIYYSQGKEYRPEDYKSIAATMKVTAKSR